MVEPCCTTNWRSARRLYGTDCATQNGRQKIPVWPHPWELRRRSTRMEVTPRDALALASLPEGYLSNDPCDHSACWTRHQLPFCASETSKLLSIRTGLTSTSWIAVTTLGLAGGMGRIIGSTYSLFGPLLPCVLFSAVTCIRGNHF
ncbi:hypothetical protein BU25DRAFT_31307 [Macroventuria anomochaeta]|uniref:Uncharacterized protein n=1 Tax=Macroventuria anomochaeta TaxID=301207 RepID=A0ACB6S368_9PLEO|nr:uncharacterized protein BU25DRAFT_31307 [Macroventuria anomochaeta]KAF2628730.1 hypothetical protein BU25DRAFT_31307 [Macroventuria anomochaeta]